MIDFPDNSTDAALVYIGRGLAPVPLPTRTKDPTIDWRELRVTAEDVGRHFPPGKLLNVAVRNGAPSNNLADVDLDCPEAVAAADQLLPLTRWRFGRATARGSHRMYKTDAPFGSASKAYRDLDGSTLVELRGTGGITVVPPSVHKETGELIGWEAFGDPGELPLADLERCVAEVAAAALLARHWPAEGSRQDAHLALAGGLARAGWPEARIGVFLQGVAAATNDEESRKRSATAARTCRKLEAGSKITGFVRLAQLLPNGGADAVSRAADWLGLGTRPEPGDAPWPDPVPLGEVADAVPFPTSVLPAPLRALVESGADAIPCPCEYVAVPLLVMAGGAVGNSRALKVKGKFVQRASIFAAVVAPPSSGKSPAQELTTDAVHEAEDEKHAAWEAAMEQYEAEMEQYEAAAQEYRKRGGDRPAKPTRPVLERMTVTDFTVEALVPILMENPRGVVVVADELTGWVSRMNRYSEGKGGDRAFFLSGWSGANYSNDRKGDRDRGPVRLRKPFLGVVGGIPPAKLSALRGDRPGRSASSENDDGFLDRILFAYPEPVPAREEDWREVPDAVADAAARVLAKLRSLEMVPHQVGGRTTHRPYLVKLAPDGREEWRRFTRRHAAEMNGEGFPPHLLGPWGKMKGYCARLALVVHLARWACGEVASDTSDVDGESVRRAAKLVDYFKSHARRVYEAVDADPRVGEARRVVRWFTRNGLARFTKRDAYKGCRGAWKTVEQLDPVLALLESHGLIRHEVPPDRRGAGRKPSPAFEVNPAFIAGAGQNPRNPQNGPAEPGSEGYGGGESDLTPPPGPDSGDCGESGEQPPPESPPEKAGGGRADSGDCGDSGDGFALVSDTATLATVALALDDTAVVAVDLETTGLDPVEDRVRLISVTTDTTDGGKFTFVVDCFAVDPSPLWGALAARPLLFHNGAFDLGFLARIGFAPSGPVHDTMLLSHLLTAGTGQKISLAACCEKWLGRPLDKSEQKSDWSGPLTGAQVAYAAADAAVLRPLFDKLNADVVAAGLAGAAGIESRCLPGVVWMASSGVAVDRRRWESTASDAGTEAERLRGELETAAPPRPGAGLFADPWNWDSTPQVKQMLALAGCELADTSDAALAASGHPLASLVRAYRAARGAARPPQWLEHVRADGRVYPHWRQVGTDSGRMSCSSPNVQQVRRGVQRSCVAAPPGRVLVKADYSQIELRIAAKVSGDPAMLAAYQRNEDLHTLTARAVLGIENVTKSDRQLAKALNFGLLYGMGAAAFRSYAMSNYGVELTEEKATEYREAFFRSYPGLRKWHRRVGSSRATETRTLVGRRRLFVGQAPYTELLNTPVQGTGADGLKSAMALLWERRAEVPGAFPVMAVHDEVVVEADAGQAGVVSAWLKRAMTDAMAPMIDPVPVEVEVGVSTTWGG